MDAYGFFKVWLMGMVAGISLELARLTVLASSTLLHVGLSITFAYVFLRRLSSNLGSWGQRAHHVILSFGASISI